MGAKKERERDGEKESEREGEMHGEREREMHGYFHSIGLLTSSARALRSARALLGWNPALHVLQCNPRLSLSTHPRVGELHGSC